MYRWQFGIIVWGLASLCCLGAARASADIEQLYGAAVHSFFEHRYDDAIHRLNQAVELGSRDPRVYYFRGLTNMQMGLTDEAREDFRTGARLEVTATGRFYPVNRSLQRVQGLARMELEAARDEARLAHMEEAAQRQRDRYGEAQRPAPVYTPPRPRVRQQLDFPDVRDFDHPSMPFRAPRPDVDPSPSDRRLERPAEPIEPEGVSPRDRAAPPRPSGARAPAERPGQPQPDRLPPSEPAPDTPDPADDPQPNQGRGSPNPFDIPPGDDAPPPPDSAAQR